MRRRRVPGPLFAAVAATAITAALAGVAVPQPPLAAQGPISVVLDGAPLLLDVPPIQIEGRILVPLRGIFERLGAKVIFDADTQTVTATRESVTILLRLGSREARVGDRIVTLDVPPLALRGRTFVPLRFVSEALGARVDWDERARTVLIYSVAPRPSPTPAALTIEGTLLRVEADLGRLHVLQGTLLHVLTVTAETAILRREMATGAGGSVNIRELRPGDHVIVAANARAEAVSVRAVYRLIRGTVAQLTLRSITLADGASYPLHLEVVISGRVLSRDE
ncbi:MAG: copper amine oxidase N-terminal domain-containing protein, partial [bacterium]